MMNEHSLKKAVSLLILVVIVSPMVLVNYSLALYSVSGSLKEVLESINYRLSYQSGLVYVCVNPDTVDDCLTRGVSNLMISKAKIALTIHIINDTHAGIDLIVRGNRSYDTGQYVFITDEIVEVRASYVVDMRYNFAWAGSKAFGFFPFFIFPAIGYNNITSLKFIYMGEELITGTIQGKPLPGHYDAIINGTKYSVTTLGLANKYLSIRFVYHIPVEILRCVVPINETAYLVIERDAYIDNRYVPLLASMSDYPRHVAYINYERLAQLIAGGVALGVIAFAVYRWRRRR